MKVGDTVTITEEMLRDARALDLMGVYDPADPEKLLATATRSTVIKEVARLRALHPDRSIATIALAFQPIAVERRE